MRFRLLLIDLIAKTGRRNGGNRQNGVKRNDFRTVSASCSLGGSTFAADWLHGQSGRLGEGRVRAVRCKSNELGAAGGEVMARFFERLAQSGGRSDNDDEVRDLRGRTRRRSSPVRSVKDETGVGRRQRGDDHIERAATDSSARRNDVKARREIPSNHFAETRPLGEEVGKAGNLDPIGVLAIQNIGEPVLRGAEIDKERGASAMKDASPSRAPQPAPDRTRCRRPGR